MGHPDFRVGGKIFATLWPKEGRGVVLLTVEQQEAFVRAKPRVFSPVPGGWGRRGSTDVRLKAASAAIARAALIEAWYKIAPKRLVAEFDPVAPPARKKKSGGNSRRRR